jgi:hypothetical protein
MHYRISMNCRESCLFSVLNPGLRNCAVLECGSLRPPSYCPLSISAAKGGSELPHSKAPSSGEGSRASRIMALRLPKKRGGKYSAPISEAKRHSRQHLFRIADVSASFQLQAITWRLNRPASSPFWRLQPGLSNAMPEPSAIPYPPA